MKLVKVFLVCVVMLVVLLVAWWAMEEGRRVLAGKVDRQNDVDAIAGTNRVAWMVGKAFMIGPVRAGDGTLRMIRMGLRDDGMVVWGLGSEVVNGAEKGGGK